MDSTLAKGLNVLEWLARERRPCRVSEVADAMGLARSNAHRTLQTLVGCGWVTQDATSSAYSVSLKLFELGALGREARDLRTHVRPLLERLASETGETIHLSNLEGGEIVYIDKLDSPMPVAAYSRIGGRAAAHCVATGKALLAALPQGEASLRLRMGRLQRHTPNTITAWPELMAELDAVRQRGYAQNREEWRIGVCGLGACVLDADGAAVAAIGISVPNIRFGRAVVPGLVRALLKCAGDASRSLGFVPAPAVDASQEQSRRRQK